MIIESVLKAIVRAYSVQIVEWINQDKNKIANLSKEIGDSALPDDYALRLFSQRMEILDTRPT